MGLVRVRSVAVRNRFLLTVCGRRRRRIRSESVILRPVEEPKEGEEGEEEEEEALCCHQDQEK